MNWEPRWDDVGKWATEPIPGNAADTFIQWKGTDLCMDLHCPCGTHNHYDGMFAHFVRCSGCGAIYQLKASVMTRQVKPEDAYITPLEDESDD